MPTTINTDKLGAKNHEAVKTWIAVWQVITAAVLIALIPVSIFWHAYVAAKLWAWFGEPVFGLHISTFTAGGLITLVRLLCVPSNAPTEKKTPAVHLATQILVPLVALGLGAFWYWLGWGVR